MTPKITIIVPTFNRRSVLPRALLSVCTQEGPSWELIVVDDGSTDGTEQMVREDYPQALYIWQPNRGPSAARNRGLLEARGEWIAFLDSDDEWLPGKLKAQMAYLRTNPDLRICQTEEIWIRNGRRVNAMKKHKKYSGMIFEKCLPLCIISPSAVMIHRELFNVVGVFDESLPACEDYDLWLRISSRYPVGLVEQPWIRKYGGHNDQRSRGFEAMDRFRIRALVNVLKSGKLNGTQAAAALKMLEEKTRIYSAGARKRGNAEEAGQIEQLAESVTALSVPNVL